MAKCKFCGKEFSRWKYASPIEGGMSCGECTAYCTKKCEIGKSGKVQGWHFEPCLSCEHNPYKKVIYCDGKIKATEICGWEESE